MNNAGSSTPSFKSGVTSVDVARLAQVSQSAVSRTFTPGASVSHATRARVLEAARKLGYRPNAIARSLSTKRSRIVGVVMNRLDNNFHSVVLEQLSHRLRQDGYHLMLFFSDPQESDRVLLEILQYQVDGIVMFATVMSSALARDCADAAIPVVLFNRITRFTGPDPQAVSAVTSDNEAGGRLAARHLVAAGHRRIAYIGGIADATTSVDRERGFREELAALGARIYARAIGNYTYAGAQAAARELFGPAVPEAERPDAVFVSSDHMAFGVMDVLRVERGLRVPDDVSVIGYDNVPEAAWGGYQLATVEQPIGPMIEATVKLLREQWDDPGAPARAVTVPAHLVLRASARPLPAGT